MVQFFRYALPLVAAGLFLAALALGAGRFFKGAPAQGGRPAPGSQLARVALCCLVVGLAVQGLYLAVGLREAPGQGLAAAARQMFGGSIDTRHYLDLAQYGYGAGERFPEQYLMIVFFPLFPALLRLLNPLGLLDWYLLGLAVQLPLFCWAGTGLYALAYRHYGPRAAGWALAFLLASPGACFFFAPMTESLFLALTVTCVLLLESGRYKLCGLAGLLAALCRAPGALLAGLALVYLAGLALHRAQRPQPAWLAPVLGPATGLGLYFLLNKLVYGDWFRYAQYQWDHWHQKMGLFPQTVRYLLDYVGVWWAESRASAVYISLAGLLCILAQLALLAVAARRLPVHHLAYGLAYTAFTTGATWLLSAPRYAVGLFCLPMALAACCRGPRARAVAWVALMACGALYTWQFCLHGPIY